MTSPDYPLKTYKFGHSDLPTAHSPFPASMQPDHNAALDGIRGGAILMVIAWHQYACTPHPPPTHVFGLVERITSYGWSGVQLFFVLSGFLIANKLLKYNSLIKNIHKFYIHRAARILPLYALCLLAFWVVQTSTADHGYANPSLLKQGHTPLWHYFAFIQNYSMLERGVPGAWLTVTWSMAVEVQFYLIFPFIVACCPAHRLGKILLLLVTVPVFFRFIILATNPNGGACITLSLPTRIDAFALGALAAYKLRHGWVPNRVKCKTVAIAGLAVFLAAPDVLPLLSHYSRLCLLALCDSAAAVAFVSIIVLAVRPNHGWVIRLLTFPPLVWLGLVSYALYLFHEPIFYLVHWWIIGSTPALNTASSATASLFALILLCIFAEGLRRFIEQPIITAAKTNNTIN